MTDVEVTTQHELDQALKDGHTPVLRGTGYFTVDSATVWAHGSATVWAYGSATVWASGSATVWAYDSATVTAYDSATVTAYDSATVTAYGSATVRASGSATVRAYDSATVRAYGSATVRAYGSATVRASGSATVWATPCVPVQDHGPATKITSGVVIPIQTPGNGREWCDFYGVPVKKNGTVVLFKSVDDDWRGGTKTAVSYEPGSKPQAPDWSPTAACGQGLHFSPRPWMAHTYHVGSRFVACPVDVDSLVVIGDKVKAPGLVGKVFECDQDGNKLVAVKS